MQSFFGVGNVYIKSNSVTYEVKSVKDLVNVIIPHFDKYPLITQKHADFLLFKSIVLLISQKEHTNMEGLKKIVGIRASLNRGLPPTLQALFPDITPVERPLGKDKEISDPNWLAGFTAGEGCFSVIISKSNTIRTGHQVGLRFSIGQHFRDLQLLNSFIKFLGCGCVYAKKDSKFAEFTVDKFSDIDGKIIPFFSKYPLEGIKRLDYEDFVKVALLIKEKTHLTEEGLEQARQIKSGINRGRKF